MENEDLKIKFDLIQNKIEEAKKNNQDATVLLMEKYELLKLGYEKIKQGTSSESFDKNPMKYSTLLSYIKSMKEIAKEINISLVEAETLEKEVKDEMKNNNLDWLLN